MTTDPSQDPLLREAALLAAHPDFDAAVRVYCAGLARFRQAPRLVNMVVATDVRWRVVGYFLYLHADRERFGPEGGATYSRLLGLSTGRGEASPRVVKTLLALLRVSGLVRVVASRSDGRLRLYEPTERMRGFLRDWLRYACAALDVLDPAAGRGRFVDDPAFADAFSVSGGRAHLEDAVPLADRVPAPLSDLRSMQGGYSVIVAVLLASLEGVPSPSRHGIAARFGLSRSQVGNVINAGLGRGLFELDKAGALVPAPALRASFRHWIAIELAFYARHMGRPAAA